MREIKLTRSVHTKSLAIPFLWRDYIKLASLARASNVHMTVLVRRAINQAYNLAITENMPRLTKDSPLDLMEELADG